MGACLSSAGDSIYYRSTSFALVVSNKGELRQYPSPIFVSEVLEFEKPSVFLCNSDSLYLDQHIPALDSEDELDAGQIYFILPKTMLGRRLSASDMAALAVKASVALDSNNNVNSSTSHNYVKKKNNNNNNARISPMVLMEASQINVVVEEEEDDYKNNSHYYKQQQQRRQTMNNGNIGGLRVSRSGSIKKIPSSSSSSKKSRRLAAVRSFRLRLSTIYENEGCDNNDHFQVINY